MSLASKARPTIALALLMPTLAVSSAAAQAPASPPAVGTITAIGNASVKPVPTDRNDNASIAAAVRRARHEAIIKAVGDARARAALLAGAGGLTLGALIGIADSSQFPYYYGPYGQDGTFGPGKYCGLVSHYRNTRKNGVFRRKLISRTRACRVPRLVSAAEAVTFTTVG